VVPKEDIALSVSNIEAFVRPATIEEAFAALGDGSRPVAGGTDVMLRNPREVTTLVDLMSLPLAGITETAAGFSVGANVTLTAMLENPGLAAHLGGMLPEMLVHVGSPLLRNVATIGGHLARGRLSDVIPVLVALDSIVHWYDGEHREGPLVEFYAAGVHRSRILITGVTIPVLEGNAAGAFYKVLRTFFDLALLNAACVLRLDGNAVDHARIVVGETPALGTRVPSAEQVLLGEVPSPDRFAEAAGLARAEVETQGNSTASAEYRTQLVGVAVERCLAAAAARLEVGS
jgi:carbon-monoxide dehydrogenase medium subunit